MWSFVCFVISVTFMVGCANTSTKTINNNVNLKEEYLTQSKLENISVEEIEKALTRSFKAKDFKINVTLQTEALLRAKGSVDKTSEADLKIQIQSMTKNHTCFTFSGQAKTYYGSASFKSQEWRGVLIQGGGASVSKLYFGNNTMIACTAKAIDTKKPFFVMLESQFSEYSLVSEKSFKYIGKLTWNIGKKQKFIWVNKPFTSMEINEQFNQAYSKAIGPEQISKINFTDTKSGKMKVILTAIQNNNLKYFKKALPINGKYTWDDYIGIQLIAYSMATAGGRECNNDMLNHLAKVGILSLSKIFNFEEANSKSYSDSAKALACGPIAKNIYKDASDKNKESTFLRVNNALVDTARFGLEKKELKNFLALYSLANIMHKGLAGNCVKGDNSSCIKSETFEENLSSLSKVLDQARKKFRRQRDFERVLKEYRQYLEQKENREKKNKKYFYI